MTEWCQALSSNLMSPISSMLNDRHDYVARHMRIAHTK
jgi:vesicle coat complex subunit